MFDIVEKFIYEYQVDKSFKKNNTNLTVKSLLNTKFMTLKIQSKEKYKIYFYSSMWKMLIKCYFRLVQDRKINFHTLKCHCINNLEVLFIYRTRES